ncbi:MAG: hypothetical protein Q8K26_04230 [Candidatus Gracilibacteria bacterium]|nr:hypothetical protein [Candidatus Gracilibacteria bacterium]
MANDYKQKYLAFRELSFEEKKIIIMELLEPLKELNETLATIHKYIQGGGEVDEKDLFDIYEAVLFAVKQDSDEQMQKSLDHLDRLKDKILETRKMEEAERIQEKEKVSELFLDF